MNINVSKVVPDKDYSIKGMSYIGLPVSNTAMYITKKVEHLLKDLYNVNHCLVFAEDGMDVPTELLSRHAFRFSDHPQMEYAEFATLFFNERFKEESQEAFKLTDKGYYIKGNVSIDADAYIEPGCVIGPDVSIGKNARVFAGSIIKYSTIGDNFLANEYSVIGSNGFTMADTPDGETIRIPTLGRVVIGNSVEVGVHNNISRGSAGDTIIEDNVKLDSLVHVAHDVHLCRNVEVTAGSIIGGFATIGEDSYVGINSAIRNRISIGNGVTVGMGSNVTKSSDEGVIMGNPAKTYRK